ncbi:LOW QUALITY PROTEIN: hypothetical protein OSB04_021863 [Centaurea solstitialis]|uniref:Integrase zinc-binding domain-containing protein n=1 Tax=Centaurea solstitialis TaxID=347529 RepID=A0AA38WEK4_9ASTR|nr:LOW QUALITY PROTEIN: hypothetical protein OSB04_021863 [Centaurea solstitialis]
MEVYVNNMLDRMAIVRYHVQVASDPSFASFLGYKIVRRKIKANPNQSHDYHWMDDHERTMSPPLSSKSYDKEVMRLYLAIIPNTLSDVLDDCLSGAYTLADSTSNINLEQRCCLKIITRGQYDVLHMIRMRIQNYQLRSEKFARTKQSTTELILRCVTSKNQMNQILQEMHNGESRNHSGGKSLANGISQQGYYWPTLRENAMRYVQSSDACQRHSGMSHRTFEPLHSILVP